MLFITAALHGSGYIALSGMAEKSNADKLAVEAFKALWLVFSVHCAALGAIFIVASRTPWRTPHCPSRHAGPGG
jgi:hypothetical protein